MIFRLLGIAVAACLAFAGGAGAQGKTELLWYSQAGFKLTTPGGKVIIIDPWIMGGTLTPPELKDLSKVGKVDLVLVTHGHGDHVGDCLEIGARTRPAWPAIHELSLWLQHTLTAWRQRHQHTAPVIAVGAL